MLRPGFIFLISALVGCAAKASPPEKRYPIDPPLPMYPYIATAERDDKGAELTIHFQDREAVANACDFHVRRMEYIPSLQTLLIETLTEPCFVDKHGVRKGELKWQMPGDLRDQARIRILINDAPIGRVVIENGKTTFCRAGVAEKDCL